MSRLEFPKLLKLEDVDAGMYKSRQGGYTKLKFEGNRFVYLHKSSEAEWKHWKTLIGTYQWVRGRWRREVHPSDYNVIDYREYSLERRA